MSGGAVAIAALAVAWGHGVAAEAAAAKLKVLYSFANLKGDGPVGGLTADSAGNLYGTTDLGGAYGYGEVFELSPPAAGKTAWTETVLFSFNGTNGFYPIDTLTSDSAGNLYGTTVLGGATYGGGANGDGVVFELSPPKAGKKAWTETVLLSFNGTNGDEPFAGLLRDNSGNLYGTTVYGSADGEGEVFELSPPTAGNTAWTETVLKSFSGADGDGPVGALFPDTQGNLYGTTGGGGSSQNCALGCGTVFELTPPPAGKTAWTETVLHSFNGADGASLSGGLIADGAGNLYGVTQFGGAGNLCTGAINGCGTVFELSPPVAGKKAWTEKVLFSFNGADGYLPVVTLLADGAGNLYGTTNDGGPAFVGGGGATGDGVVFELSPPVAGKKSWTESVLAALNGTNGETPAGSLIADSAGNLYGPAYMGGAHTEGTVFRLTP